jgi:chromosome partitioning protein
MEIEPKGKAADEIRSIACEMLQASSAGELRKRFMNLKVNAMGVQYGSGRSEEKRYAM